MPSSAAERYTTHAPFCYYIWCRVSSIESRGVSSIDATEAGDVVADAVDGSVDMRSCSTNTYI